MSKAQGKFNFSVHHPFKLDYEAIFAALFSCYQCKAALKQNALLKALYK